MNRNTDPLFAYDQAEVVNALAAGGGPVASWPSVTRGFKLTSAEAKACKEWKELDDSIQSDVASARERFSNQGAKRLAQTVASKPRDRSARLALVEEQAGAADRSQFDRIKASSSDSRRTLAKEFAPTVRSIGVRFEKHVAGIAIASWKSDQDECADVGIHATPSAPSLGIASTWRIHRELRQAACNPRSPGPDSIRELIAIWSPALGAIPKPEPAPSLSGVADGQGSPLPDPDTSGKGEISGAPV
jgi:hypothetical protein